MESVLYADILFFINFSMDFITLYLTSRLTSGPPAGIRFVLAAALGGIYGTFAVAVGIDGIPGVLFTGGVSVIMVLISFGYGRGSLLLRRSAVFWGGAALLGGIMTALCSFGDSFGAPGSTSGGTTVLFLGSTLCLLAVKAISHFKKHKILRISVTVEGRVAVFDALCDSGNLVSDPMTGIPVIIADRSVLRGIVPELCTSPLSVPPHLSTKIRMIPVKGIGGGGLMTGFIPDSVSVTDSSGERKCTAVIAVSDLGENFFGGYPANSPMTLI
ncbi:MAG: sigma-E processing peptidase SpoIIGA [Clostridia bacterium]|nr:sigma-E processing peptidase SpoIIGA [Clostridia bacterium]